MSMLVPRMSVSTADGHSLARAAQRRIMSAVRQKNTKLEMTVRRFCMRCNIDTAFMRPNCLASPMSSS